MRKNYNNTRKKLFLPEYGRHIHEMVDSLLAIGDRRERNRQARAVIAVMGNLFPLLRDTTDFTHKLWDHLFIMSDFRLDVDVPFEPVRPETFEGRPEPMPLPGHAKITFRHYGSIIEEMIAKAAEMPEGPERTELVYLIASQMKKSRLAIDRDGSDDERIFNDLHYLSKGAINVPRGAMVLAEYKAQAPQPAGKKRKKK